MRLVSSSSEIRCSLEETLAPYVGHQQCAMPRMSRSQPKVGLPVAAGIVICIPASLFIESA